jgi:hypothetical protein
MSPDNIKEMYLKITCNDCREMDVERFSQAVNELLEQQTLKICELERDYSLLQKSLLDGVDYSISQTNKIVQMETTLQKLRGELGNIKIRNHVIGHNCYFVSDIQELFNGKL